MKTLGVIILLVWLGVSGSLRGDFVSTRLPDFEADVKKERPGWQGETELKLAFPAASSQVRARMRQLHYVLKHEIDVDKKGKRRLFLWEKGRQQIIIMLWYISVDRTGCTWGGVQKEDSRE